MNLLSLIITIISVIIGLVSLWKLRGPSWGIRWVMLQPQSMMEIAEEVSERLEIKFDNQPIDNLTKFTFILHNSGSRALTREAILRPLTWTGPGTVLSVRVVATLPPVDLDIQHSDRHIEISWQLFNQRCKALIEVLCESGLESDRGTITGQIRDVPEIDTKEIFYINEEDARRRIEYNLSRSRTFFRPRLRTFFRPVRGHRSSVFFLCHMQEILESYIILSVGGISCLILAPTLGFIPTVLTGIATILVLWYRVRNPYSKLLRLHSSNASNPRSE